MHVQYLSTRAKKKKKHRDADFAYSSGGSKILALSGRTDYVLLK